MKEKITSEIVNGCQLNIVKNTEINTVEVHIMYGLPTNIQRRFVGVPHLFEHLTFNDIIPGVKSSTDIMSMANNVNVDLNAFTAVDRVVFTAKLKSFLLLDRRDAAYDSFRRFDMSEDGLDFIKKYITGVVQPHAFTEIELEAEKGIILAERAGADSVIDLAYDKLAVAVSGVNILGSAQDIREFDLDTLNEFASLLPKPTITIKYNPNMQIFDSLERHCVKVLNSIKGVNNLPPTNKIDRLESISNRIYNGETDIRVVGEVGELNAVAITYPVFNNHEDSEIEDVIMDAITIGMISDSFLDGSIANILREKKNITYALYEMGLVAGDRRAGTHAMITPINTDKFNLSDTEELSAFCNLMNDVVTDLRIPSETEFITALSNYVSGSVNRTTSNTGIGISNVATALANGYTPRSLEIFRTLPFKFNYRKFVNTFNEFKDRIAIVIL